MQTGVCYAIFCILCEVNIDVTDEHITFNPKDDRKKYIGTSGRSTHVWVTDHMDGFRRKNPKNALYKHTINDHSWTVVHDIKTLYRAQKLTSHNKNLQRLVTDALLIEMSKTDTLLNSTN